MKNINETMKITDVLEFAGQTHLIYTLQNEQYISLRPLTDQIGMDWRTQKKGLLTDELIFSYGVLLLESGEILQPPCKFMPKTGEIPRYTSEKQAKIADFCTEDVTKDTLFIRLKRVYIYLARISLGHVGGTGGNKQAVEILIDLQEEWADALYDYETHGIAIKKGHDAARSKKLRDFLAVCKEKRSTEDENDRKALGAIMQDMSSELGYAYQTDLFDDAEG